MTIYRGHLLHVTGSPTLEDAAEALVSEPDGALAVGARRPDPVLRRLGATCPPSLADDGVVVHRRVPDARASSTRTCTFRRLSRPTSSVAASCSSGSSGASSPRNRASPIRCSRMLVAAEFVRRRDRGGHHVRSRLRVGLPRAQDALFTRTLDAGLRIVSGRGIQTVGPASAAALLTSEDAAIGLARGRDRPWHGRDAGGSASDARSALAQVAVVPRFSLAVTAETLGRLGDLYAQCAGGRRLLPLAPQRERPAGRRRDRRGARRCTAWQTYLDTYDGRHLPGSQTGGESLLGQAQHPGPCRALHRR